MNDTDHPRRVLRLRSELRGEHVHMTLWMGRRGRTLANVGTLVLYPDEWQALGAVLLAGDGTIPGRLVVETSGETAVGRELARRAEAAQRREGR